MKACLVSTHYGILKVIFLLFSMGVVDIYYTIVMDSYREFVNAHLVLPTIFYIVVLVCRPIVYGCFGYLLSHRLLCLTHSFFLKLCRIAGVLLVIVHLIFALFSCTLLAINASHVPMDGLTSMTFIVNCGFIFLKDHPILFLLPGSLLGVERGDVSPPKTDMAVN